MKNILKLLVPVFFLVLMQESVSGQQLSDSTKKTFKHYLGFGVGQITGRGLSYRYMPKRLGVQATFAPFKSYNQSSFNLGVSFLYRLVETNYVNFFAYQGTQYISSSNGYNGYRGMNYNYTKDKFFNTGVGLGVEFTILKRLSLNLMGGYSALENFDRIDLTGDAGLYFKF